MPLLVYLLAVAVFAQGTSEFVLAGLLPGISAELAVPVGTAGLLTSGFALGMVIGAPIMAVLARRLPAGVTLAGFLTLFILAHVAGALAASFPLLLATRVVAALVNAGFLAVTMSAIARLVEQPLRPRALSVILGGTALALVAGVPAGAVVGGALGWRATLLAIAVICVPALAGILRSARGGGLGRPDGAHRDRAELRTEIRALGQPRLLTGIVLAALANAATFCGFTYLAVIAVDGAGLSARVVPALLAVFGAGAFVGVTASGRVSDAARRRLVAVGAPALGIGWVAFAALVIWGGGGQGAVVTVWPLAFALGALSFGVGSTLVGGVLASATNAPTMGGSYSTVALNLGAVAGPALGGLALGLLGTAGPLIASALFALLTAAVRYAAGAASAAASS